MSKQGGGWEIADSRPLTRGRGAAADWRDREEGVYVCEREVRVGGVPYRT